MTYIFYILAFLLSVVLWSLYRMADDFDKAYKADKIERGVSPPMLEPQPTSGRKLELD